MASLKSSASKASSTVSPQEKVSANSERDTLYSEASRFLAFPTPQTVNGDLPGQFGKIAP